MARGIPASFLGLKVAGDLGGNTFYTDRYGRKIVYPISPPKERPSVQQVLHRNRFARAVAEWQSLSEDEKTTLEKIANRNSLCATGQNVFISAALRADQATLNRLATAAHLVAPVLPVIPPIIAPINQLLGFDLEADDVVAPYGCTGYEDSYLQLTSPPSGWGASGPLKVSSGTPPGVVITSLWPNLPNNAPNGMYYISLVITQTIALTRLQLDVHVTGWRCQNFHETIIQNTTVGWPSGGGLVTLTKAWSRGSVTVNLKPQWPPV